MYTSAHNRILQENIVLKQKLAVYELEAESAVKAVIRQCDSRVRYATEKRDEYRNALSNFCDEVKVLKKENAELKREAASYKQEALRYLSIGFNLSDKEYGCFSNLYLSDFEYAGKKFSSVEQFMTYHKVLMAQDYELAEKIMTIIDPEKIRELGSDKYFADYEKIRDTWTKYSHIIARRGIRAKFLQNINLLAKLLLTGNSLLAECSEADKIWANGISIKNPNWKDVRLWTGSNMTGRILMEVRREFLTMQIQYITPRYIDILPLYFDDNDDDYLDPNSYYNWWTLTPAVAVKNPLYHDIIYAYVSTLSESEKEAFLNGNKTFNAWQKAMQDNAGCKLRVEGFFEMKQDMFDTTRIV